MGLLFDARWKGSHGIGRFAREVRSRLPSATDLTARVAPWSPIDPAHLSWRLLSAPRRTLFYSPGYNAPLAARVPFVFTIHDLNHIRFAEAHTPLKALYYERVMRPACARAEAVVTVSEYSRADICEWSGLSGERVINVGNGVNPIFTPEGERFGHPQPFVFCVGNRKAHKNEERSIKAFGRLADRVSHDLLLCGEPNQALRELIHSLALSERVHFLGAVDDRTLAAVYRSASVVLFASLYEGFGLPVLEAMASGTPVVTSNVCSLPEVAGGAALLVNPRVTEEIAAALEQALTDTTLAQRLVQLGMVNAVRYSWDKTGASLRTLLSACEG